MATPLTVHMVYVCPQSKIHIARYGKIPASQKVINAIKMKAKGLILYAEPVSINDWRLPDNGIVRESVVENIGDPQTPGWPTLDKVYKLTENVSNSRGFNGIPDP